jgi:hypothetical protein
MSEQIKNIKLKFSCTADWDSMPVVDGVKSCEHCSKKVYDFTGSKQDEFLRILAENNNNICGRFSTDQMAVNHPILPAWKKWVSAALVLVGINLFNKVEAQTKEQQPTVAELAKVNPRVVNIMMGEPIPITTMPKGNKSLLIRHDEAAKFPGGISALSSYILKKGKFKEDIIGRMIVSFTVNTDGTLSDYKIIHGLDENEDKEVIDALKSSPKWEPAISNGKAVKSVFILPVTFN